MRTACARNTRAAVGGFLAIAVGLSACAGANNAGPLTPAQQELQQSNARFNQTIGEGAAIGALTGVLAGYLAGHDAKSAAIGGAAGAAVGAGAGYLVARNNLQQAHTEADLQTAIREARDDATAFHQAATASNQIAQDARHRVAQLDADYRAQRITADQYRSQMSAYQDSAKVMESQINRMQQEEASLRTDASRIGGSGGSELSASAQQIDQSRRTQERALAQLRASLSEVPAG